MLNFASAPVIKSEKPMTDVALIIFDCDGVLVDSEPVAHTILCSYLEPYLGAESVAIADRCVGRSYADCQRLIESIVDEPLDDIFWNDLQEQTLLTLKTTLKPDVKLRGLLESLPVPFCVASSGTHDKIRMVLGRVGVLDLFEGRIFSAEDVEVGKPEPDLFLRAADRCNAIPEACLVVEDSGPGLQAAVSAGMQPCHYAPGIPDCSPNQINELAQLVRWLNQDALLVPECFK